MSTQTRHPWRTTVRSIFQGGIALAAGAPVIYSAAFNHSPEQATGAAATTLAVAAAVTRVMALPAVDNFLKKYVPFLASEPNVKVIVQH